MASLTSMRFPILIFIMFSLQISSMDVNTQNTTPYVSYEDFGAMGDGKTDDLSAIHRAHQYANRYKLPVKANDKATYYIGSDNIEVIIKTNTNFGKARFIIDDTKLQNPKADVFKVKSDLKSKKLKTIRSLKRNQSKLDLELEGPAIVAVYNSNKKQYIRKGGNRNNGSPKRDTFLVDPKGDVDKTTPIVWDFEDITELTVTPMDSEQLLITGGLFTTWPSQKVSTSYHKRGIRIERSNVVVDHMTHLIEKNGENGSPYSGFISISKCANVTVKNTIFTGRMTYFKTGNAGSRVPMGSYGISVGSALNIKFINCSQSNSIHDKMFWGIMGTNFCKNLELDGCTFSRFDAHQGVTNLAIRNSEIGYMGIMAIGHGRFLVENTKVHSPNLISFRPDYGSSWKGDIEIRDCAFFPKGKNRATLFSGRNTGDHYFGYTCYMPENIHLENIKIEDKDYEGQVAVLGNFNRRFDEDSKADHPIITTKKVVLNNVKTSSGKKLELNSNSLMFKDVMFINNND